MAQVENVDAEQAEEHDGLRPLRGVAPEHAGVLDDDGAGVGAGGEGVGEAFEEATPDGLRFAALRERVEPGPPDENAAAALDGRGRVVKEVAHFGEGEHRKKEDVAKEHEEEEAR